MSKTPMLYEHQFKGNILNDDWFSVPVFLKFVKHEPYMGTFKTGQEKVFAENLMYRFYIG